MRRHSRLEAGKEALIKAADGSQVPAREVKPGDKLDFQGDPYGDNDTAQFEFALVDSVEDEGSAILIHTDQGSFGFPPDHKIWYLERAAKKTADWNDNQKCPRCGEFGVYADEDGNAYVVNPGAISPPLSWSGNLICPNDGTVWRSADSDELAEDVEIFNRIHHSKVTTDSIKEADVDGLFNIYDKMANEEWYDGSTDSIVERSQIVAALYTKVSTTLSSRIASSLQEPLLTIKTALREEMEQLKSAAEEMSASDFEEYLSQLPGGTVAMDYKNLIDGGLVDMGTDDGSTLWAVASEVQAEAKNYDWERFASEGAALWINDKMTDSQEMLRYENVTREAAIDYVRDKTMILMDTTRRAKVIDDFVNNAERHRREAAQKIAQDNSRKRQASLHGNRMEDKVAEILASDADIHPW